MPVPPSPSVEVLILGVMTSEDGALRGQLSLDEVGRVRLTYGISVLLEEGEAARSPRPPRGDTEGSRPSPETAPGPAASAPGLWCSLRQAQLTGQCPGPVTAQSKHVGRECHLASVSSASSSRNCHVKTPTVTTDWKHVQKTGARRWFSLCTVSRPRPQMLGGAPASARLSLERRSSFSKPQNKVLGWTVTFQFQANLS